MLLQLYNKGRKATGLKRSLTKHHNNIADSMNSRVMDAAHVSNSSVVYKQKRYTTRNVLAIED